MSKISIPLHGELDIDPFFMEKSNVKGKKGELVVSMDSEDETGSYLIQFYNHNTAKPSWTDWSEVPIEVTLQQ